MPARRRAGMLRRLATLLIRGKDAVFILTDLDDAIERDLARGAAPWKARSRYATNLLSSALHLWWSRTGARIAVSWIDVKLGLRILHKQPVLTIVAVLTLALGIPVGVFPSHLADAVEAPLPVDEGERIRTLVHTQPGAGPTDVTDLAYWRERLTTFEALAATTMGHTLNVVYEDGSIAPVDGAMVTASTFDVLRAPPLLGRTLVPADERVGAPEVVVIGEEVWQSRFAGDPNVVGRLLHVGGVDRTVVGVMPESFRFPMRDLLWLPLRSTPDARAEDAGPPLAVFGRLADGVAEDEASAELAAVGRAPTLRSAEASGPPRAEAMPFWAALMGDLRGESAFVWVQLMALLVLVVSCANVAMLIFARTVRRASELAVRTALGASRARVISQLFVEALLLALLAAGTGLLIGDQVVRIFVTARVDQQFPVWLDLGVTSETVARALFLAAASAGLAGVLPALRVTGKAVQPNLQRAAAQRSGLRFGGVSSALIVADVTLAVAAACFAIYFAPIGDDVADGTEGWSSQFLAARLSVPALGSEATDSARLTRVTRDLVLRLGEEPGIRGVTIASHLPGMDHPVRRFELEDPASGRAVPMRLVANASVAPGFFETLGHPVLSGRAFAPSDSEEGTAVIVNTDFVERILGGRNPLGQRIRYAARGDEPPGPWLQIVGVVGRLGTPNANTDGATYEAVYHPLRPGETNPVGLAVAVADDPASFVPRLRQLAIDVDPTLIVDDPQPLDEVTSNVEFGRRLIVGGGVLLVVILVGLAASGTYALMSFTVTQRTREIGIRTALGARQSRIVLGVARRALVQLGIGAALGMILGVWVLSVQQGVPTLRIVTPLLVAATLLVLVGLLACTGPTLRALRITPTEALKAEG